MSDKREDGRIRRAEARPSITAALLCLVIAAAGLFLADLPMLALQRAGLSTSAKLILIQLLYYLPFVALPIAVLLLRRKDCLDALRPNPIGVLPALMITGIALMWMLLTSDLQALWTIPFEEAGIDLMAGYASYIPSTRGELLLRMFGAGVLPAVCEEALFRGVLLSALEPRGTRRAMLITALLFAGLHGSVVGLPGEILAGLLTAYLVLQTDSIYAGLIFHTVYNCSSLLIQYTQRNLPAAEGTILTQIGGASGVLALCFEMLLILVPTMLALRTFALYGRVRGFEPFPPARTKLKAGERVLFVAVLLLIALTYLFALMPLFKGVSA